MSRRDDLEGLIRNSYDIIHQYEEIARTSDRPEEVQRSQREIEEQRGLIWDYLVEYLALCQRRGWAAPEDIDEIAATFGPELAEAAAAYRPPLVRLPPGRGWIYGAAGLAVLFVVAMAVLLARQPAPAPTPTSPASPTPPPTETITPSPAPTATFLPPLGEGALYRVGVAEFYTQVEEPVEIALWIERELRAALKQYGLSENVDLKVISEAVKSEHEAQALASAAESDVLIWGWRDTQGIALNVLLGREAGGPATTGLRPLRFGDSDRPSDISFYVTEVMPSNTTFLSLFIIGHLYYLSNDYAEGRRAFDAAMENIPERVELENAALVHFFNARLMETTTYTDPTDIICEYARAIELDPDLSEAYNNLGVLIMQSSPDPFFMPTYAHEQEPCVQAAGLISLEPSYLFSQTLRARSDWALPRYNLAVLDWNRYSEDVTSLERARDEFARVLELDPTIPGAHIARGNLAVWDGDFDAAVDHFTTALDLGPESSALLVNLGQALALAGQDEEAIAAYRRALALDAENREAHLALGNLHHRRGDLSRAYEEYQQAGESSSELPGGDYMLALELVKYDIDHGAWLSATERLAALPFYEYRGGIEGYVRWLIASIQGDPEASPPPSTACGFRERDGEWEAIYKDCYPALQWTNGAANEMTWYDLVEWCAVSGQDDVSTWGGPSNPCLPADLEERLEAVYAQFQHRVHHRLFFNKALYPGGLRCPHVYSYDDRRGGWYPDTVILYDLVGPEAEQLQARPLARFDGRLWLRELEPETSYVDQLTVRVLTGDGHWLALAPDDPALAADDGDYLVLRQGDERLLTFEVPSGAPPVQRTWVVAAGYYVPHGEEE